MESWTPFIPEGQPCQQHFQSKIELQDGCQTSLLTTTKHRLRTKLQLQGCDGQATIREEKQFSHNNC